jgi:hypothetical protein
MPYKQAEVFVVGLQLWQPLQLPADRGGKRSVNRSEVEVCKGTQLYPGMQPDGHLISYTSWFAYQFLSSPLPTQKFLFRTFAQDPSLFPDVSERCHLPLLSKVYSQTAMLHPISQLHWVVTHLRHGRTGSQNTYKLRGIFSTFNSYVADGQTANQWTPASTDAKKFKPVLILPII